MASLSAAPVRIAVTQPEDVHRVRRAARALAGSLGFDRTEGERVALAVGELASNLVRYAIEGVIVLSPLDGTPARGIRVESHDRGPGIADLTLALRDGYSTGGGLGDGLPAVRRLMDSFEITSSPLGTAIIADKWPRQR